jgi:hypothetical protein
MSLWPVCGDLVCGVCWYVFEVRDLLCCALKSWLGKQLQIDRAEVCTLCRFSCTDTEYLARCYWQGVRSCHSRDLGMCRVC